MATHHTTGGSAEGLGLFDTWSSKGQKYPGFKEVAYQWKSLDGHKGPFITIGTLKMMAGAVGANVSGSASFEKFEPCETIVVDRWGKTIGAPASVPMAATLPTPEPLAVPEVKTVAVHHLSNPLAQYSLRDKVDELERNIVGQVFILNNLALMGQAAVWYALANTGKTLILLWLLIQAIKANVIDPANVIYINMDDNGDGLLTKARLAAEYGFHMVADGHEGFEAKVFRERMQEMIDNDTARGVIVVLDTLKKFVDTMSKEKSSNFARVVRQFVMKGGSVIALAHANKNPTLDGRIVYSGTTDIVDDFDVAYTLKTIGTNEDAKVRFVEFTNIKRRGSVVSSAAYSFSTENSLSYNELLLSVEEVDRNQLPTIKQTTEVESDAVVMDAIAACINEGVNTKMKLADAASKRAKVSNRAALKIIEKYTGSDPVMHRWTFGVQERGAKVFQMLDVTAVGIPESSSTVA